MSTQTDSSDKAKALELAIKAIEKGMGKGTIITGNEPVPGVEFFSSGCLSLDKALGGGWAKGRIIEVFGPESSGKTTLCLHAIAEMQKLGGKAAFVDAEHAFDPIYAQAIGINMNDLIFSQPSNGEEALEVVKLLTVSNSVDLIVIDSVASLVPKAELEGEVGDSHIGRQARLMGQAMRMVAGKAHVTNTTLMFINQIRMKVGVMFGNPETTPGGNALKFYASQIVDIRRTGGVKDGEDIVGNTTKAKVTKSKVAPPFKIAEFEINYGQGINVLGDILDTAVNMNIVEKSGAWFSYNGEKLGQGKANACKTLADNPALTEEIRNKVI